MQEGGLKINAEKSETMVSEGEGVTKIRIEDTRGNKLNQAEEFKYLEIVIASEGGLPGAVRQRVKTVWYKWRELSGVMCKRKIPKKLKYILYKTVVRLVLLYGAECWAVGRREKQILEKTEMQMLRRIAGVTLKGL